MNKGILLFFLFIPIFTWAEVPKPDWAFVIKGFQDVDLAGVETDKEGNVYACGIYSGWMEVPGIKERFKAPNHVAGFLIKISSKGKILWGLPFLSSKDTRITKYDFITRRRICRFGIYGLGFYLSIQRWKDSKALHRKWVFYCELFQRRKFALD
jgi:hypothetical protein